MWLLDTNTCSYILRNRPPAVRERLKTVPSEEVVISTVVLAELYYGAALHPHAAELRRYIADFVSGLTVKPWDAAAANHYGDVRAELERKGQAIGNLDMMIAAHARSLEANLVTNNLKHFRRVPGLKLENWL
jgi:tRNA(fMet)-specific endonuclease VapC